MGLIIAVVLTLSGIALMVEVMIRDKKAGSVYNTRREEFIKTLDDRQLALLESLQGASDEEIILGLEKRIFDLENASPKQTIKKALKL